MRKQRPSPKSVLVSGRELRTIRKSVGLGVVEFGMMLGYDGNLNTLSRNIRRLEALSILPHTVVERLKKVDFEKMSRKKVDARCRN